MLSHVTLALLASTGFGGGYGRIDPVGTLQAVRPIGTITADQLDAAIEQVQPGAGGLLLSAPSDVGLFKISYTARGYDGSPTRLSGLVALPKNGAPKGWVLYCHGTQADRSLSPSRFNPAAKPGETFLPIAAFSNAGYGVFMPDYIGLGDSPGIHPYPLSRINAWAGIDMIPAAQTVARQQRIAVGRDLYVTGYSEGGAVAMWTARQLQGTRFTPKAAAPLSGPYDLTDTTLRSVIATQSNKAYLALRFFLVAYVGISSATFMPGLDLEDMFVPSFATYVPFVWNQNLPEEEIIKKLSIKGLELGAISSIRRILQPSLARAIDRRDMTHPLLQLMASHDTFNWRPTIPMLLFAIRSDYVVVAQNTTKTVRTMRGNGVGRDTLQYVMDPDTKLNHVTAMPKALILARRFFDNVAQGQRFEGLPTQPD